MSETAVLLLAHGTPSRVEEIPEYLRNVTGGRALPSEVIEEVAHRFQAVGGSPLTDITFRQAKSLHEVIRQPVYVGMRNWHPFIAETVKKMEADGVKRAVAICLAPQNSRTSVGKYRNALHAAQSGIEFDFVESWHDHPGLIRAFAEALTRSRDQASDALVIFTAHSVPESTIKQGEPYAEQARQTAALVGQSARVPEAQWKFAYQSQGMSGGPWLGPTVESVIDELVDVGHQTIIVQPIGFVSDHIETLYDLDIAAKEYAAKRGLQLLRPPSLNDAPALIAALTQIVTARLAQAARQ